MQRINSAAALEKKARSAKAKIDNCRCRILICAGTGCLAGGSGEIYEEMKMLAEDNPDVRYTSEPA